MKAFVYTRYGSPDVLQLANVDTPIPKDDEVLIRVMATTVTSGDCRVRSLRVPTGFGLIIRLVFGVTRPRQPILGTELAGVVTAVGKNVSRFQCGDAVFAFRDAAMGCYAAYACMPQDRAIALKPAGLSFEQAACLSFGGSTALYFLRKAKLQRGERVLIHGASGSVGTAAVQLAKHFGAEVTAVCSQRNAGLVTSLGADHVIDYGQVDFATNGQTYDVIMDTVGTVSFARCKQSLKPSGRLLLVAADLPTMLHAIGFSLAGKKKIIVGTASANAEDLRLLAELAETGVCTPTIDRCYPFDQMVQAHHYVDTGRKVGNVVVQLDHAE